MAQRLYIDLEKCRSCKNCQVPCSYLYHPFNDGIQYLREIAEFAATCRQCEAAPCIEVCPTEALEKMEDGVVVRWNMRCVACNSCSFACPFGTILPELINYAQSRCDYCLDRLSAGEVPVCVGGCEPGAIQYGDFHADEKKHMYSVGHYLVVHSIPWKREAQF